MRTATERERLDILQAYRNIQGYPDPEDCGNAQIGILPQYCTDGPGYAGPLAVMFWPGCEDWITLMKWEAGKWVLGIDTATILEDRIPQVVARLKQVSDRLLAYEDFKSLCEADLETDGGTITPSHDEIAAELFTGINLEGGITHELVDTGSVTVRVGEKQYVVSLLVEEDV